ncbi:peptidase inhibitor family I36 protein [Kitasatospora sp. P5_F3]
MKLHRAAAVTLAGAFTALGLLAQPAMASSTDNSGAWVTGGTVHNYCAVGDFCLYTGPSYTGRVYGLPNCTSYALHEWNGVGSYRNNQTPAGYSTDALFKAYDGDTIGITAGYPVMESINFSPVWYVVPCHS